MNVINARRDPQRRDEGLHRLTAGLVEQVAESGAYDLAVIGFASVMPQKGEGRRVGFEHFLVVGVDDQNRFGGKLEEQAIAFFRVADAGVFPLHRLLRLEKPLLERGEGALVAADRHDASPLVEAHNGVADGNVRPPGRRVVHLPPA